MTPPPCRYGSGGMIDASGVKRGGRKCPYLGASLRIDDLSLVDEGWFECRILLLDQPTDEFQNGTWTFLSITAPPSFVQKPPSQVEVLLGDPVILSCAALGNPKPTVSWRKGDVPAEEHEAIKVLNGTLSLAKVTRETSGLYKCHVSNSEGNLTHSTQLLVKGPPIIIMPPEDVSMNMSQDAVLPCQAEAHPANLTYEWWKDGENIYHIETLKSRIKVMVDGTLLISELIPEDSGNYTCVPTNGLLTPPSASAYLKVKHPARVVRMPRETYLPAGMGGVIVCPVQAEPPMLFVNWTKDGDTLNLDQFPGWMVNSEGSVFITTANDDAVGMYTCTAYNSYGTMGQSEPTKVILQDPPAFNVTPRAEYLQEVGRGLLIPCSAAGDPTPNITWAKVGPLPRSPYALLSNGSLLLRPLSKDHQGGWECRASNRVATVTAGTVVLVLGTSPHSVSSVSVVTEMHQANVSWEPGFDGGYMQKFSVCARPGSAVLDPCPGCRVRTHMLVTGLMAGTSYQFSVLPQNKLGSGPFSEIVTVRTIAPPTDPPTVVSEVAVLAPPTLLSVNRTSEGILLQWVPPPADSLPITSFVLQARLEGGKWVTLDGTINANSSDMLVQGLLKDSLYDLRMLSRRDQLVSEPSQSVNISTSGMDVYPVRTSLLAFIPEPLLAGVIAGVCFLLATIVLSLVTICIMSRRRDRKKRKRRDGNHSNSTNTLTPPTTLTLLTPPTTLTLLTPSTTLTLLSPPTTLTLLTPPTTLTLLTTATAPTL
ncbi:protein turtle homolog A-like [Alosa alosa]|uniref:protein turtle homolog A-like n=1 Tax=Alosa alosa TaxID=278164 RepID=UPI0020154463|nr:protein turtle homolog A-like [Alosa alosa]